MSSSITSSICALCRRPLPEDASGSATRLCDSCRRMVDNIRPAASRGATGPAPSAPTHQTEPVPAAQMPPRETPNSNISRAVPQQEVRPNTAWAEAPPAQAQPDPAWVNTPSQSPATNPGLNNAPRQPPVASSGLSGPPRREPPANPVWSDVVMVPSGPDSQEAPYQPSTDESAYHQNWPIIVEEAPPRKRGKGFLALFLFVVMAGAAAVAFLVFKDKFLGLRGGPAAGSPTNNSVAVVEPKPQDSKAVPAPGALDSAKPLTPGSSQSPGAAASPTVPVATASVDSGKPAQATQAAQATPPAQATPQAQATPSAQAAGAKMTSFQTASFPNEASAKQFQDKLVQAGLPAYVVAADIPHRGKWYRVRVGKFASQEEARQAGESWRKRAAAAGINLQLVP